MVKPEKKRLRYIVQLVKLAKMMTHDRVRFAFDVLQRLRTDTGVLTTGIAKQNVERHVVKFTITVRSLRPVWASNRSHLNFDVLV